MAWNALGETRKAIGFHEQRMEIAREIGDRAGEANALGSLGNAWHALGDTRKAIDFYEQALAIARAIGDRRGEGNSLGNLGAAWSNLGEAQGHRFFRRGVGDRSRDRQPAGGRDRIVQLCIPTRIARRNCRGPFPCGTGFCGLYRHRITQCRSGPPTDRPPPIPISRTPRINRANEPGRRMKRNGSGSPAPRILDGYLRARW